MENVKTQQNRIIAIDRFRGLAVFCMIVFQLIKNFNVFGILTKIASHNLANGIIIFQSTTLADLIAPMFMFAIALTYKMSFDKRVKLYGRKATNIHFLLRYLGLIGVGAILYTINIIIDIIGNSHTLILVDYFFIVLSIVALLIFILYGIFSIKPLKKHKGIFSKILFYTIAVLGLLTVVVGMIDFAMLASVGTTYVSMRYWMVLQALGFAGLIALPFMNFNLTVKAVGASILLVLYTIYYNLLGGDVIVKSITQGGFIGGFGWAVIILIGSIFADIFKNHKKLSYLFSLGVVAITLTMYFLIPINKSGVQPDPTYLMTTTSLSILAFYVFNLFNFYKLKFDPLAWWGKYPILLYLLEFGVIGLYTQIAPDIILTNAPLWLAIIVVLFFTSLFTIIVYLLNKKNKKVNL